jgi:hypothetical protein
MTPSAVRIHKVESTSDFRHFFNFPWKLYKKDPNWVPPLLSMRHEVFDKRKGAAWEYLEGDFFTAWRGDQPIGTIAAYINHRHNQFHQEHTAWFGAFECVNDPEAAHALLGTAVEWARSKGYDTVRGPQTFTPHEEVGLVVEGFSRPVLLMPYNPPYYADLIEAAGFAKVMDTVCFTYERTTVVGSNLLERLDKITARTMQRNKITVRPFDIKRKAEEFRLLKELYNAGWEKNWGFVPLTERELDGLVDSLGVFLDPRLVYFGYVENQPAGFILGIPDFNQVLYRAYPRPGIPEPLTLLAALFHWKIRPVIDWTRIPLMGVRAEHRSKGVDAAMYFYLLRAMLTETEYAFNDSGWVLEINRNMIGIAENFGGRIYKRFRLYEHVTNGA